MSVEKISQERWDKAQSAEIKHYDHENADPYETAVDIILRHFNNLDAKKDLVGKKILESGGGTYPAIFFCKGLERGVNVEPLYDKFPEKVKNRLTEAGVETISSGFEDVDIDEEFDEVWFFNVLQHVRDPYLQIEKAKKIANTIRVFEPIECGTNDEHPHEFTIEFFEEQFPGVEVNRYKGGSLYKFHGADCAYLIWSKLDEETN